MRVKFEEQLAELNIALIKMGALVETAIKNTVEAMKNQDVELARKTVALDFDIDNMEKEIEALGMRLLLQQQPVARDLRLISAAMKMSADMERIGDHSEEIAELTIAMADAPYVKELIHIPQMAAAAVHMVTESIDAFVKKDLVTARTVMAYDDEVDNLFATVKHDLINLIHKDSSNGSRAMDLYMVAKYFERIGDHAVSIARWVVYSITGVHEAKRAHED
jgi:phosphate transport system protein